MVLWQGSAGDRRPYADLVVHSEIIVGSTWTFRLLTGDGSNDSLCV
jgi:hypothetical protein